VSRIFLSLALFSLLLLAVNLILGLTIGDYAVQSNTVMAAAEKMNILQREIQQDPNRMGELKSAEQALKDALVQREPIANRKMIHLLLGVATSLVSLLVNCISVTYFVGTSKWCGEVCAAYGIDSAKALESQRLKRKNFPWAVMGSLAILAIVLLGGAADPDGMMRQDAVHYVNYHLAAAFIGIAVITWAFFKQAHFVASNFLLIQEILDHVKAIRAAKGLDVE
jgi:hypothetical protein